MEVAVVSSGVWWSCEWSEDVDLVDVLLDVLEEEEE